MNERPKFIPWHVKITERFDTLMEKLGIPDDIAQEVRTLLLEVAKEQYKSGNKSGIRWFAEKHGIQRQSA
jgi:hypothetical protein